MIKRHCGWMAVVLLAGVAAVSVASTGGGSSLRKLLETLERPDVVAQPALLAQAEAAAPGEQPAAPATPATPAAAPVMDAPVPDLDALMATPPAAPAADPMAEPMAEPAPAPAPVMEAPAPDLDALMAAPPVAPAADPMAEPLPEPAPMAEPMAEPAAPAADPFAMDPGAAPDAPAVAAGPLSPEDAAKLEMQERVRRQAEERQALLDLDAAAEAMRAGQPDKAFDLYSNALTKLPAREATLAARARALAGRSEAAMAMAQKSYEEKNPEAVFDWISKVGEVDTRRERELSRLKTRAEDLQVSIAVKKDQPVPVKRQPEILLKKKTAADFVAEGREYFEVEEYNDAERNFENALRIDPYNTDAMKYLRKIEERRIKVSEVHRRASRMDMVQDVVDKWNPPLRAVAIEPPAQAKEDPMATDAGRRVLQDKMQAIIIPSIEFRQANIVDVINFLQDASQAADPAAEGINIILKLDVPGGSGAPPPMAPQPADPFADPAGLGTPAADAFGPAGGTSQVPLITLNLRRVTLLDAIKYVTEVTGLKYRIEERVVVITPVDAAIGTIFTRMYPVMPSIGDLVTTRSDTDAGAGRGEFITMGGQTDQMERTADFRKFFSDMGVPFPANTSVSYNPSISQLVVRNTAENLEIFERILAAINVVPNQVEIEARFVEVAQNDLEALGFEWLLTDTWNIANREGPGALESKQRIQMNPNAPEGFTRGLRYYVSDSGDTSLGSRPLSTTQNMVGNLFSMSAVLTNPELSVILHAIDQKGGMDVLSSPRVTTRSGVNAQIKVVEEIIYPTEYESQMMGESRGGVIGPGGQPVSEAMFRPPVPGSFETREVGVILNVTPTVGPDGYTIDLTLVPEVAEFVRWVDYGPAGLYPILQPIFASRAVTTSIVLWDGQTVVMGGLIRDQTVSVDDKIPILGDIPILGKLFSSKGSYSRKQNLIIFVTAKLVDPAGNPIHSGSKGKILGGATALMDAAPAQN